MKIFSDLVINKIHFFLILLFLIYGCSKESAKEEPPTVTESQAGKVEKEKKPLITLPALGRDAEGYYRFGVETIKKGDFDLAVKAWKKAAEIDPTMVKAYNYLGRAYYTQGMMDSAIEAYKKTVELEPDNPDVYINLGIAFRYNEMYDEAINELNKAIELNPLSALAYDEIGMALLKLKKNDEAIDAYKNAAAIDKEFPEPHNHLGVVYLMQGRTKEADIEFKLYEKLKAAKRAKQAKIMGGSAH